MSQAEPLLPAPETSSARSTTTLGIYLLERTDGPQWGEVIAFVIMAKSPKAARMLAKTSVSKYAWPDSDEMVTTTRIGTARPGQGEGVVLNSWRR